MASVKILVILFSGFLLTSCAVSRSSHQFVIMPHVVHAGDADVDPDAEFDEFGEFGEFDDAVVVEVWDPLEGYNRFMFAVNDKLYGWVLRPVARGC